MDQKLNDLMVAIREKQENSVWGNTFKVSMEDAEKMIMEYADSVTKEKLSWLFDKLQEYMLRCMEAEMALVMQKGLFGKKKMIDNHFKKWLFNHT